MARESIKRTSGGRPKIVLTALLAVTAVVLSIILWLLHRGAEPGPAPLPEDAKVQVYTDRNADPRYIEALASGHETRMALAAEREALKEKLSRATDAAERAALEGEIAAKEEEMRMAQQAMAAVVAARRRMEERDRAAVERGEAVDIGAKPGTVAEKRAEFAHMVESGQTPPLPAWSKEAFLAGAKE